MNGQKVRTASPMPPDALLACITVDADISHGKPSIRSLRFPVEFILELFSVDTSVEEILDDYGDLERLDIQAVLLYAARLSQVIRIQKIT